MHTRQAVGATLVVAALGITAAQYASDPVDLSAAAPAGNTSSRHVSLSGDATGLLPGLTKTLDVRLRNDSSRKVTLTSLSLTIVRIDRRHRSCALNNYAPVPYTGQLPLTLGPRQTATLSQLGISASQMPGVRMIDKPAVAQDMCLGATLTVEYRAKLTGKTHGGRDDDDDHHHHHDHNDSHKHRRHDRHHGH